MMNSRPDVLSDTNQHVHKIRTTTIMSREQHETNNTRSHSHAFVNVVRTLFCNESCFCEIFPRHWTLGDALVVQPSSGAMHLADHAARRWGNSDGRCGRGSSGGGCSSCCRSGGQRLLHHSPLDAESLSLESLELSFVVQSFARAAAHTHGEHSLLPLAAEEHARPSFALIGAALQRAEAVRQAAHRHARVATALVVHPLRWRGSTVRVATAIAAAAATAAAAMSVAVSAATVTAV